MLAWRLRQGRAGRGPCLQSLAEMLQTQTRGGRNEQHVRDQGLGPLQLGAGAAVYLVADHQPGSIGSQAIHDGLDCLQLLGPGRISQVHDDQQTIGLQRLLHGGAEGLQQGRWQILNETNRVGNEDFLGPFAGTA